MNNSAKNKNPENSKKNKTLSSLKRRNPTFKSNTEFINKNPNNKNLPGKLVKKIEPKFNRAVLFDTSLNSWHGVNEVKSMIRKSMAVYYLIDKKPKIERRYKALYSPLKNQMKDKKVKKFIKMRANPKFAFKVAKI